MDSVLEMLAGLSPHIETGLKWLGLLASVAVGVVWLTPTKVDDKALGDMKKIPVLGGLIAAILGRSPLEKRK